MFNVPYAAVTKSMRQQSKGVNFGLPYGMGDESLGARIFGERNKENTKKAADLRKKFFQGQELIGNFFEKVRSEGVRMGYTSTQWGRRRYYHKGVFSVPEIRRQAGNHVIQGCVHGSCTLQTKELGLKQIKDVAGMKLSVWDGQKWSKGDILYSGKKQKCIVHFKDGQEFICSPIHKFLVKTSKGNEHFVECKDLRTAQNSRNAHRVVMNENFVDSDWRYDSSLVMDEYKTNAHNSKNIFLNDIGNSYDVGILLGRLASDGSIIEREDGGSLITQYVAEHENNILGNLKEIMGTVGYTETHKNKRKNRNEIVERLNIYSKSLVREIKQMDLKHTLPTVVLQDTQMLRGYLRGLFDGDGGISGKRIALTFGSQYDFMPMFKDIQKALLFFGIRSNIHKYSDRHVLSIKTNDNQRFLDEIGFINQEKQEKGRQLVCKTDEHVYGKAMMVESVEITDEYIDMYDVCNTDGGYYVADGVITHNTAADIYKQAVNNLFLRICKEGWLGKVLINGFIHDEVLLEVHKSINPYYFFKAWREEFEVRPAKYCRLYAGAGVGKCWYDAKKADFHPLFIQDIIDLYHEDMDWNENIEEFLLDCKKGFKKHKTNRIQEYILNEENQGEIVKPAISAMLVDEVNDIILPEISGDEEKVNGLNAILKDNKLELNGSNKVKGLQDQLRTFCYVHDLDYSKTDIKSADDVQVKVSSGGGEDFETDEDEIEVEVNKEELLEMGLISNGIIVDQETRTIHMAELWMQQGNKPIQGSKYFIEKYMIQKDVKGYKIKYYPNLKGAHPVGTEIKGYYVPFENAAVLMHFYREMQSKGYAMIVK